MNGLAASCGGVSVESPIFTDLVRLADLLLSFRCEPKCARDHVRVKIEGSAHIASLVIKLSGTRTSW